MIRLFNVARFVGGGVGKSTRYATYMKSWQRILTCSAESEFGRFWHAGLNNTGSLLLLASIDNDYSVWDIASGA